MNTVTLPAQLFSAGHALDMDADKIGLMRDSSDAIEEPAELRRRFESDGYLFMKGCLDRDQVLAARADLTAQLAAEGALDERFPAMDGICKSGTGYLFKPELTNRSAPVQRLLFSGRLVDFYRRFFGEGIGASRRISVRHIRQCACHVTLLFRQRARLLLRLLPLGTTRHEVEPLHLAV